MNYYVKKWVYGRWDYIPEIGLYQCRETARVSLVDGTGMRLDYTILPGFRTDGGSIPKMLQKPFGMKGWYEDGSHRLTNLAFVLHDSMYCGYGPLDKQRADKQLRDMLLADGWPAFKVETVYFCVRYFACRHWGTDDLDNEGFFSVST